MAYTAREAIRSFICPRFPDILIQDHDDMFALGFVNSLFAMELVMFVEKEFDVQIPNDEMELKNFRTIDSMVELVGHLAPARTA
jgi:methoxymalonate biosynthesis acyl carrier protein